MRSGLSTRSFATNSDSQAKAAELVTFGQKHVAKGLNRLVDDVIQSAEGSYMTMTSGKRFLDFTTGIGVTNLGQYLGISAFLGLSDVTGSGNRSLPSKDQCSCS